jgi:uncharacterized membrane protein
MNRENQPAKPSRYWEIDALRGVAIIWMAAFHLTWDLVFFRLVNIDMFSPPWPQFSQIIATTFLSLFGISLTISYNRAGKAQGFRKYLLRGGKILGFGMIVTLVTYLFVRSQFVVFGILHLIGFSIVAAYPFLRRRRRSISLIAGLVLIAVGVYVNRRVTSSPWLIWLGINQLGRSMADWYPVLPWFGVVLASIAVGHTLYPGGHRRFALPDWSSMRVIRELSFLGQHSLLFYLVHQPVLIGLLWATDALASVR